MTSINPENRVENFDAWQNSTQNYVKYCMGESVDDFKAMDDSVFEAADVNKAYNEAIKDFAQEYINKYDNDGNGKLDYDEFVELQQSSYKQLFGDDLEMSNEIKELFQEDFSKLASLSPDDSKGEYLDAKEYATFLGIADACDEGGMDGNITYEAFNSVPEFKSYDNALKQYYNGMFGQ